MNIPAIISLPRVGLVLMMCYSSIDHSRERGGKEDEEKKKKKTEDDRLFIYLHGQYVHMYTYTIKNRWIK